ncbi:MAG: excinuclease ABC subunit C [Thiothrix sp.]|nr:MAG: excinuclease ABC subunit C [Thiothrix sp.]
MGNNFDSTEVLKRLPVSPGIYRMIDEHGEILYVGKAKYLKKRVSSYFTKNQSSLRIAKMVGQVCDVQVTVTETEAEALLLESNLIKRHLPRYNILLRDDKSYPYLYVSTQDDYPRLALHRGTRSNKGRYFGPYPSASALRYTLSLLQKAFKLRLCDESFFKNRSRPCLQYQIKRCSAPCVEFISKQEYADDLADGIRFLEGKSDAIINDRVALMEQAAGRLEYEEAAKRRDQIDLLRHISQQQHVSGAKGDADVIAVAQESAVACVQVIYIRSGNNIGSRSFFPKLPDINSTKEEILGAFIGQYYASREIPDEIIVNTVPPDYLLVEEMLRLKKQSKITLRVNVRSERAHWVDMAQRNVELSLRSRLASKVNQADRLEKLQQVLSLDALPGRMECFDISHTSGEATVASCVVFNEEGPLTSDYRRFNIKDITPGDDYAAMQQALTRRYKRLMEGDGTLPEVLFIDGGKGQLSAARKVLDVLQVQGVMLVGIAKGEGRKPGLETLFIRGPDGAVNLPENSPALHLIQHIRDEAHRFAITGHRRRRAKSRLSSSLESIPGLGPKRRQSLLKQFGGLRGISRANPEELAKVPGISKKLAEQIYAVYHS